MTNTKRRTRLAAVVLGLLLTGTSSALLAQSTTANPGMTTGNPGGTSAPERSEQRNDATTHVNKAVQVLQQMQRDQRMAALLKQAKGVFVVPDYGRAALGVGGRGGAGVLLVHRGNSWGNPAFYNMGGISVGAQAGAEAGAIAMVLNNQKALDSFKQNNKFSLNAGAGLTLVDWSAKVEGSANRGDITIWSDTEGLFGGATVSVTDINFDEKETEAYYQRRVAARDVLSGKIKNPQAAALRQALANASDGSATRAMGSSGSRGKEGSGMNDNPSKKSEHGQK